MKAAIKPMLIFLAGAIVGGAVLDLAYNYVGRQVQEAFQFASLSQARQQAEAAYFQRSPEIAEWELTKLLPRLSVPTKEPFYSEEQRTLALFLTHARLAKVQQAQGKRAEADQNLAAARQLATKLFPGYPADGTDPVSAVLSKFDEAPKPK
jgi:hypothetical protein